MPHLASLFAMPNPRRWDKATIPPASVSWLPMAALILIIVIGPALALATPHLSLGLWADFGVSAAVMVWALRKSRSCERAAVLALLRWILHASLLQGAFGPLEVLPVAAIPAVLLLFCEPALTAVILTFSTSARWYVEKSVPSRILRWEDGAPLEKTSLLSMFVAFSYAAFLVADVIMLIYVPAADTHAYFAIGIIRSILVLPIFFVRRPLLLAIAIYALVITSTTIAAISYANIADPLPVIATNITTVIYLLFSDHQRARIWRQVRT